LEGWDVDYDCERAFAGAETMTTPHILGRFRRASTKLCSPPPPGRFSGAARENPTAGGSGFSQAATRLGKTDSLDQFSMRARMVFAKTLACSRATAFYMDLRKLRRASAQWRSKQGLYHLLLPMQKRAAKFPQPDGSGQNAKGGSDGLGIRLTTGGIPDSNWFYRKTYT